MNPWMQTHDFTGEVKIYYDNLSDHLVRFRRNIFVETGTFLGNGLQCALQAGFRRCYTIEIHEHLWQAAQQRFSTEIQTEQVISLLGNSEALLLNIVQQLTEPAVFWLDAHVSGQYGDKKAKNCPIMEELQAIDQSKFRNHVLLIDDLVCFGHKKHDRISLDLVKAEILKINPAYKFELLDAAIPKNILGAYV